jgi:hypothetical protein
MITKLIPLASSCLLLASVGTLNAQNSALWGANGATWTSASRLQDFSWAGYRSAAAVIPLFPTKGELGNGGLMPNGARPNDTIDDSDELQALIDNVVAPATIIIPAGRWYIGKRIYLRSRINLRGETGAVLFLWRALSELDGVNPATTQKYSNAGGYIIADGNITATVAANITANAARGAGTLTISAGSGLVAGDLIEITQTDPADKSLAKYMHANINEMGVDSYANLSAYPQIYQWYTRVGTIVGNTLTPTMDVPLNIQTNWSPRVRKVVPSLTEVGIQDLTIQAKGVAKLPHLNEAGWNGIQFSGVINGWIRNVNFIDTDSGILLSDKTSFCSIVNINTSAQFRTVANSPEGEVGHHAIWCTSGASFNLINTFNITKAFHHDLSCEGLAHHNVFMNGQGAKLNFDQHRNAPWANLFTNINVGDGSRVWESSGRSDRGPHTAREMTVWNIRKNSGTFPPVPFYSGSDAGTNQTDWPWLNVVNMSGLTDNRADRPEQWVELGTPGQVVTPANIFSAQQTKRLAN